MTHLQADGYTTFSLPEIIDADAIQDVDTLRALLHRENREHVFRMALYREAADRAKGLAEQLSDARAAETILAALAAAHQHGDAETLVRVLDQIAAGLDAITVGRVH